MSRGSVLLALALGGFLIGLGVRHALEAHTAMLGALEARVRTLEWQVQDCRERVIRCCTP